MQYPIINNINDILPHIKDYPEFGVRQVDDVVIIQYKIRDSKTFSGPGNEYRKECRGITFDAKTGDIICRPFHKFFNVNETEETFETNIDWDNIQLMCDKRDGSMLTPFLLNDKLYWKTKNSLNHEVCQECYKLFPEGTNEYQLSYYLNTNGYTPIFEFTSLINRVVIRYPEPELTLLAVRNIKTGEYLPFNELVDLCTQYKVKLVDVYDFESLESVKQNLTELKTEGFVFVDKNGERFKWKTNWYNELHHAVSFITEYQIAMMSYNDTLDDYKSFLIETQSPELLEKVNTIETDVKNYLLDVDKTVESIIAEHKDWTPKDFSLKFKNHELFSLLIAKLRGKEIPGKWFENRITVQYQGRKTSV